MPDTRNQIPSFDEVMQTETMNGKIPSFADIMGETVPEKKNLSKTTGTNLPTGTEDISIQQSGSVVESPPIKSLMGGDYFRETETDYLTGQAAKGTGLTLTNPNLFKPKDKLSLANNFYKERQIRFNERSKPAIAKSKAKLETVLSDIYTGDIKAEQLQELSTQSYGKEIIGNTINTYGDETTVDAEGGTVWDNLATNIIKQNRKNGVEAKDKVVAQIDESITGILSNYKGTNVLVSGGTGGAAVNVNTQDLPVIDTNNPSEYGRLFDALNNTQYLSNSAGGVEAGKKEELIEALNNKLFYLKSKEPVSKQIEDLSTKIGAAITRVNMGRERGENIDIETFATQDKINADHFKAGLNFIRDSNPGKYKNIIRAIENKEQIADTDFEQIAGIGQEVMNFQIYRGAATDPSLIGKETDIGYAGTSYQSKKSDAALAIGEYLKDKRVTAKEYSAKEIREAANKVGVTNAEIVNELVFEEGLPFYDAIPKAGTLEAFVRGLETPLAAIKNTIDVIEGDAATTYLRSQQLDVGFTQKVKNAKGQATGELPSERGNVWYDAIEGFGQFIPQVILAKGIGGAVAGEINLISKTGLSVAQTANVTNLAGTAISTYLQEYGSAYEDALQKTGDPLTAKAMGAINGISAAAFETFILPDVKIADAASKLMRGKYAADIVDFIKKGGNPKELAQKGRPIIERFVGETFDIAKQEVAEEVGTNIVNYLTESIFSPKTAGDRDLANELYETAKATAITMIIPSVLGGGGSAMSKDFTVNGLNSAAINIKESQAALNRALIDDNISQDQYDKALVLLKTHKNNITTSPEVDVNGKELTTKERLDYAYQETQIKINEKKSENISGVQKEVLENKIKQAEDIQREILIPKETEVPIVTETDVSDAMSGEEIKASKVLAKAGLPDLYAGMAETDPIGVLKDIAKQAQNLNEDFIPHNDGKEAESLERAKEYFGEYVVNEAIKLYQPKTQTNETTQTQATPEAETSVLTETETAEPPVSSVDAEKNKEFIGDGDFRVTNGVETLESPEFKTKEEAIEWAESRKKGNRVEIKRHRAGGVESFYATITPETFFGENQRGKSIFPKKVSEPVSSVEGGEVKVNDFEKEEMLSMIENRKDTVSEDIESASGIESEEGGLDKLKTKLESGDNNFTKGELEWLKEEADDFLSKAEASFDADGNPQAKKDIPKIKKFISKIEQAIQSLPKGEAAKQPIAKSETPLRDAYEKRIDNLDQESKQSDISNLGVGDYVAIKNETGNTYTGFVKSIGSKNVVIESPYGGQGGRDFLEIQELKFPKNQVKEFYKPLPKNEKETTPISDTPKNQSADIGTSEKTGEATTEGKTISQKGKELADRIRGLKSKRDILQANIFGIPIAIYDGALEVVATAIETGAELAQAIQNGIKYIRDNGGNDLDEAAFTGHINDVSQGVKPKVKVQVGEPEGTKKDNKAVIGRLMKSENVPDEVKEIFKENDLKYKVRSQAEARKIGNAVIESFGIDEAVSLAEAGRFHGDVNSMIFALSLDRMYDTEQSATTPEAKQEAAEQYADIAMRYQDAAESGGRFISAINDFYKKSPAGLVIKAEKEFKRRQDEYFEGREKPTKEAWQEFINTVEGKELLEEEMEKKSPKKKKLFTPDTEAKIKNFFSKLKINTKDQAGSYLIPPQIYNAAIDVIENAVLAGVSIGKAIEQAVEYIGENYKEAWKVKEFKKDIRDGFKKQNVQRVLSAEDRENVLKKWNKKLIGLDQEQKNTLLNKAFLELIDNGALEYDQFKQLYAEALGLPQMTPELAAQLKELATKINEPSKIKDEILKTKSPELISKYRDAVKDAEIAATKLNDLIGKQKWWLNTFLTVMRLNTLGAVSLVGNIAYNVAALPVRFAVNLTATGIDYLLAGAQLTSDKVFGTSLYTKPPTHNVFKIQGGFLRGLWLGTTTSIKQFFTGLSNRDYFQKEIKQNIKPLTSAKKFIRGMTGKQKLTLNEKLNSFIEAFPTMGMSAEVIARALNIGDKGFRFAAEFAKAEQLAQQKGLKGIDKEIFILFPDEESENKIREAGEKIVFQQKNVVTKAMDSAGNAISNAVKKQGGEAKLLHGIAKTLGYASQPFLNTPLNVFNEFIHYAFPPLPLYRAGKAMVQGDSEKAVYHLSQAVVGLSIGYAATQLVAQGLISGSGDDDEQKERIGIQTFQRQGQINLSGLKRLLAGSYEGVEDDDTWVDLKYYGFMGMLLLSKASQYKGKTKEQIEGETLLQDVVGQFVPAVKTGLTEGVFSGTSSLLNAISMGGRYTDNWVLGMGNVFVNAFEPNWLRSLSMANNNYIRDTRDMSLSQEAKNQLKNRFFSGKDLPSKIDIWGERIESVPVGSNRYMYNIMGLNKKNIFDNDQFGYALYDYYNQTKNYNIFPPVLKREVNNQALTPEQYEQFSILVGSHRRQLINPLIQSGKFEKLKGKGVEEVTKELDKKYDEARKLGVKEFENVYPEFKLKKKK